MQRLDQVLRELQPVLKTLNEKSNALVFEAKDKKILSLERRNNEKMASRDNGWRHVARRRNKSYYQLPIAQSGVQSTASQGNRLLWVEQVSVPDYLAGNGVVYQTSDVQYVIANNNLWASPLDQQLRNTLVANLSARLLGWVVASQPLGTTQIR